MYSFLLYLIENKKTRNITLFFFHRISNLILIKKILIYLIFDQHNDSPENLEYKLKLKIKLCNFYLFYKQDPSFIYLLQSKIKSKQITMNIKKFMQLKFDKNLYIQTFLKRNYKKLRAIHEKINFNLNYLRNYYLKKKDIYILDENFFIALGHYSFLDIIDSAIKIGFLRGTVYVNIKEKNMFFLKKFFPNIKFKNYNQILKILNENIIEEKKIFFLDDFFLSKKINTYSQFFQTLRKNILKENNNLNITRNIDSKEKFKKMSTEFFSEIFKINFFFQEFRNKKLPFWLSGQLVNLKKKKLLSRGKILFKNKPLPKIYLPKSKSKELVCIHVREDGFHKGWNIANPSLRNANFNTYESGVFYLLNKGITVCRIGDSSMKLSNIRHHLFHDLTSKNITFQNQLHLISNSKFCIMTNSGISLFPDIFNIPVLYTNWAPLGILNWTKNSLFVPKLVKKNNKILNCKQMISNFSGWSQFKRDYKYKSSFEIFDNTEIDLLNSIININDEVDNNSLDSLNKGQKKIQNILKKSDAVFMPKICPIFQKKYNF